MNKNTKFTLQVQGFVAGCLATVLGGTLVWVITSTTGDGAWVDTRHWRALIPGVLLAVVLAFVELFSKDLE